MRLCTHLAEGEVHATCSRDSPYSGMCTALKVEEMWPKFRIYHFYDLGWAAASLSFSVCMCKMGVFPTSQSCWEDLFPCLMPVSSQLQVKFSKSLIGLYIFSPWNCVCHVVDTHQVLVISLQIKSLDTYKTSGQLNGTCLRSQEAL